MCSPCDSALETSLNGQYLNELCDCDTFKRWICSKCVRAEHVETAAMYRRNSVGETWDYDRFEELYGKTRMVQDHQFQLLVRFISTAERHACRLIVTVVR